MNVSVKPLNGYHMSDYDFDCEFYVYSNRRVLINKSEMVMIDDDNYVAVLDSEKVGRIGKGHVRMTFTAYVPNEFFPDGLKTEKEDVCTDLVL